MSKGKGILFIISGPSGVGKGTVLKRVFAETEDLSLSVSCTTRSPREGEKHGVHYYFISQEEFRALVEADGFYEYVDALHKSYGTPKKEVDEKLRDGKDVVLEIETTGAANIKKIRECVSIFIAPPSLSELKRRLSDRKTETPEQIAVRMRKCENELPCAHDYDYVVVNDDLDKCVAEVVGIIESERLKAFRNHEEIEKIIKS